MKKEDSDNGGGSVGTASSVVGAAFKNGEKANVVDFETGLTRDKQVEKHLEGQAAAFSRKNRASELQVTDRRAGSATYDPSKATSRRCCLWFAAGAKRMLARVITFAATATSQA